MLELTRSQGRQHEPDRCLPGRRLERRRESEAEHQMDRNQVAHEEHGEDGGHHPSMPRRDDRPDQQGRRHLQKSGDECESVREERPVAGSHCRGEHRSQVPGEDGKRRDEDPAKDADRRAEEHVSTEVHFGKPFR